MPPSQSNNAFLARAAAVLAALRSDAAGGVALILGALVALVWANLPWFADYQRLIALPFGVSVGGWSYVEPATLWVNDGLMALFFAVVGLEIRHEMTRGQLASSTRRAAPAVAALGGMAVPALIYVAVAWRHPGALRGWAIPTATDIAFSLAVLRLLGSRVPPALVLFLTALAIIDDVAAITVIALFYTDHLNVIALAEACLVGLALFGLNRLGLRSVGVYLLGGLVLWAFLTRSGVHPSLAGVALALVVPMDRRPGEALGPARRLELGLSGWVALVVLPLFGLANAGLPLASLSVGVLHDPVAIGIVLGLVVGKPLGVFGATWLSCQAGLTRLPDGVGWRLLAALACLCGIGFTVSLFIGQLAFGGQARALEVKLAVFAGSLMSAGLGLLVLWWATKPPAPPVAGAD